MSEPSAIASTTNRASIGPIGPHTRFLPELDGLRAVCVLLVVCSHLGLGNIIPGSLGVTVFFFISGFIITRLLLGEFKSTGSISLPRFYARRFLRLSPALFGYLLASLIFLFAIGWQFNAAEIASVLFYVENYYHIFVGYTRIGEAQLPFGVLWSLAVEEHFYLLFPAAMVLYRGRLPMMLKHLLMLTALVLGWRVWLCYGVGLENIRFERILKATDTRLDSIAYGCIAAVALERYGADFIEFCANRYVLAASVGLMLSSLVVRDEHFRESVRYSIQGLAMISIVMALVYSNRLAAVSSLLRTTPMLYVGKLSYSLYLYHWLAVGIADHYVGDANVTAWRVTAIVLAIVGTLASYYLLELPASSLRRRFQVHAATA